MAKEAILEESNKILRIEELTKEAIVSYDARRYSGQNILKCGIAKKLSEEFRIFGIFRIFMN